MKNGIFSLSKCLSLLALLSLSSCASLLSLVEPDADPADMDRGYVAEATTDEECTGRFCRSEAARAEGRALASVDSQDSRLRRAIDSRDVVLGMTRQHVMASWGEPLQREVAGRGATGNERWTYGSRYSLDGSRTVIFENGRVAGWQR